jgi:hypothetical protein
VLIPEAVDSWLELAAMYWTDHQQTYGRFAFNRIKTSQSTMRTLDISYHVNAILQNKNK